MNAALIPVRSIGGAKNRLAEALTLPQRSDLALAMLADMIAALSSAGSVERIVVVTGDRTLVAHASRLGAECIDEGEARGLNGAVRLAARRLEDEGVTRLLTIPGDVPLITPFEIDGAFSVDGRRYPVVIIPSLQATGTNGLLTSPPTVVSPEFEGESLDAHRKACARAGVSCLLLALEGFAVDVDTTDDLAVLASGAGKSAGLVRAWQSTGVIECS